MSDRRVPPGGGIAIGIIVALLMWFGLFYGAKPAHSQAPQHSYYIFADTAGVSAIGDSVYITWIFARTSPTSLPSSAVLVGFDCKAGLVQRYAHVVYQLTKDSSGVAGPVVEDVTGWVPMTNPQLFNLVCTIGPTHGAPPKAEVEKPKSPYFQS